MNKPPKERGGDSYSFPCAWHLRRSSHVTAVFLDANRTREQFFHVFLPVTLTIMTIINTIFFVFLIFLFKEMG